MISRPFTSFLLVLALLTPMAAMLQAQEQPASTDTGTPGMLGRIVNGVYISPTKMFRMQVPVLAELGGTTTDADNGVVTFQDNVGTHVSLGCFVMDATQRWNEETRGRKEYLTGFFADIVRSDFAQHFAGTKIESARFRATLMDGAVFAFVTLPGGTMFGDRTISSDAMPPAVAKRGNLLFIKDEHVYVISMELAEKVLERSTWDKTPEQENEILEQRLLDILSKISFTKVPPRDTSTGATSSAKSTTPTSETRTK